MTDCDERRQDALSVPISPDAAAALTSDSIEFRRLIESGSIAVPSAD